MSIVLLSSQTFVSIVEMTTVRTEIQRAKLFGDYFYMCGLIAK